jgi:hypothetical protein
MSSKAASNLGLDKLQELPGGFKSSESTRMVFDPGDFAGTRARSEAKEAAKRQKKAISKQKKIEDQRLAEAESEVKRRELSATRGRSGRRSLIATSETGRATTLGGS